MLRLKYSALVEVVLALFVALLVVVAVMMFTPGVGNSDGETFIPDGYMFVRQETRIAMPRWLGSTTNLITPVKSALRG